MEDRLTHEREAFGGTSPPGHASSIDRHSYRHPSHPFDQPPHGYEPAYDLIAKHLLQDEASADTHPVVEEELALFRLGEADRAIDVAEGSYGW